LVVVVEAQVLEQQEALVVQAVAVLEQHLALERLERQTREAVAVVVLTLVLVLVLLAVRALSMCDSLLIPHLLLIR
jgi:hypothetical protein